MSSIFYRDVLRLIEGGLFKTAAKILERKLDKAPNDYEALGLLGKIKLLQGHPRQAAELLELSLSCRRPRKPARPANDRETGEVLGAADYLFDNAFDYDEPGVPEQAKSDQQSDLHYILQMADQSRRDQPTFDIYNPFQFGQPERSPKNRDMPGGSADDLNSQPSELAQAESIGIAPTDIEYMLAMHALEESSPSPEFEIGEFADYIFDLEDDPLAIEDLEVAVDGPVTRRDRARKEAIDIGLSVDWSENEIEILVRVFEKHGWSNTKRVIVRELGLEMTSFELDLADNLRDFWQSRPEFSVSFERYSYPTLSWPLALTLVRRFPSTPDVEEIQFVVSHIYDGWYSTASLRGSYTSFYMYLRDLLGSYSANISINPSITISTCLFYDMSLDIEADYFHDTAFNGPTNQTLMDYDLLPNLWEENSFYPTELANDY